MSGPDSVEEALTLLGVSAAGAALYARLLLLGGTPAGMVDSAALAELVAEGLAVDTDNWIIPADPSATVHRLVSGERAERQAEHHPTPPAAARSGQVLQPGEADAALQRALAGARRFDVIDAEPYTDTERRLDKCAGLAMRIVLSPASAATRADDVAELVRAGVPLRAAAAAPAVKVWLVDDTLAVVGDAQGMSALGEGPPRRALHALFDALWSGSTPVSGTQGPLPAAEAALLALIDRGLGDTAICARFGISKRTLYRRLERLMVRAGVSTRPQLAAEAVRRGWLR